MDTTGKEGIKPTIESIVELHIMPYKMAFDEGDELCGMSESSVRLIFEFVAAEIVGVFRKLYFHNPNEVDL